MNDSDSTTLSVKRDQILFYNDASFYCSVLTAILCLIGLAGNIISALIFSHRTMKAPINNFLTALSVVDAFVSFLALPVFVIPYLDGYFAHRIFDPYYPYVLIFVYPLSMIVQTMSVWILTLITVERYVAVCYPFLAGGGNFILANRPKSALLFAFLCAILFNFVRFWEFTFDVGSPGGYKPLLRADNVYYLLYYTVIYLLTHYFVPFVLLFYLSIRILVTMRSAKKERQRRLQRCGQSFQRQQHTSEMVIIIAVSFFLCNTLSFALNIWEAGDVTLFENERTSVQAYFLLTLSNTLIIFNSSVTFVIYYCFCRRYRRLLCSLCRPIVRYKLCRTARQTLSNRCDPDSTDFV